MSWFVVDKEGLAKRDNVPPSYLRTLRAEVLNAGDEEKAGAP